MDRRTMIGTLATGVAGAALSGRLDAMETSKAGPAGDPLADYTPCPFEFGSGLPEGGHEEQRVVTEADGTAQRRQDLAVPFTFGD